MANYPLVNKLKALLVLQQQQEPADGACSSDGQFVWRATTSAAPGHWERKSEGETCTDITNYTPTVTVHAPGSGGGVSVDVMNTYRTVIDKSKALTAARFPIDQQRKTFFAQTLPPCPTSGQSTNELGATVCYDVGANYADASLPPGSFVDMDLVFNVGELQPGQGEGDGSFARQFVPTPAQRTWMEAAIVAASAEELRKRMIKLATQTMAGASMDAPAKISVGRFLQIDPSYTLTLPNFTSNPPTPTDDEMQSIGGLAKYFARGGFLISLPVAQGQISIDNDPNSAGVGPAAVCISPSCACPGPDGNVYPRCIGAWVTTRGLVRGFGGEGGAWFRYLAVDNNYFYYKFKHKDDAWYTQAGEWLARQLTDLAKALCGNKTIIEGQMAAQTAPICRDTNKQPCQAGTKGCTCTQPAPYATAGNAGFNVVFNQWCDAVNSQDTQIPNYEPPASIPTANAPVPWWQLGLVVAAGLGIGALAFSKR